MTYRSTVGRADFTDSGIGVGDVAGVEGVGEVVGVGVLFMLVIPENRKLQSFVAKNVIFFSW
jgi:hypothetical protein